MAPALQTRYVFSLAIKVGAPIIAGDLGYGIRRIIPISATRLPPTEDECRYFFRKIARKAGIPDRIWNMDARAGANTEAYEAGATEEEAMALLTHTEAPTNRGYLRDLQEQSHRAAVKRVGSRTKDKT